MKNKFFKKCLEIAVIVIGNAILAFGICAFITPHGIIVGGASGLGLIVKQITGIPLSLVVYVINIIMFIAGYFFLGKSFAAKTLLSTIIFPTFLTIFENTPGVTSYKRFTLILCLCRNFCRWRIRACFKNGSKYRRNGYTTISSK